MTSRGIACAALLAALAAPSRARAWGPTGPVGTLPASAPQAPQPSEEAAPPPPDAGPAAPAETPPPETAPPVAAPPEWPPVAAPAPLAPEPPPPAALPPQPLAPIQPIDTTIALAPAPAPIARPRLSAAVGMGATFDAAGFSDGSTHTIPAFFTVLGIGDGLLFGFDLGAFASQASGRFRGEAPIDRLAVDAFGVVRPAARFRPEDQSYQLRLLRALAAELGLGFERDGRSAISGTRFMLHTGARVDLPLSPAGEPTEVRLRLAMRRAFGLYQPKLSSSTGADAISVGDSAAELYAALVVVF